MAGSGGGGSTVGSGGSSVSPALRCVFLRNALHVLYCYAELQNYTRNCDAANATSNENKHFCVLRIV